MYATFAHIASHSVIAGIDHSDCDHDGDTEKRPASEHCVLNDTIAALACRYDHSSSEIMKAMLIQAILPGDYLIWVQEKLKDKEYPVHSVSIEGRSGVERGRDATRSPVV